MNKRIFIGIGVIAAVVLLAGGAFVGARLLGQQTLPIPVGGDRVVSIDDGNGSGKKTFSLDFIPAPELPQTPADERGIFVRRQDSSVFIGTGNVRMQVQKDASGQVNASASHDGPDVEIVIPHDAKIYKDVTLSQYNGDPPSGQRLQQVLETGALDEIGEDSTLTVWGTKTGDRINASIVVYSQPAFLSKPLKNTVP